MRTKNIILLVTIITMVIIGYSPLVSATTSQWFPSLHTNVRYALSISLYMKNGTIFTTNQFDVYNFGEYSIPSINKYLFKQPTHPWTLMANSTTAGLSFDYNEQSVTQWSRSQGFESGVGSIYGSPVTIYYFDNISGSASFQIGGSETIVNKNQFFTGLASFGIVDYFDNSLGLGGIVHAWTDFSVTAITSDSIIASYSSGRNNITYVASKDGRVQLYSDVKASTLAESVGVKAYAFICTFITPPTSPIPSFPFVFTILGLIVLGAYSLLKKSRYWT